MVILNGTVPEGKELRKVLIVIILIR
uniref:Uncharacterized protein n=1 Tax=Arundo donax TaxID=35708 RepID=A0A0A8Z1H0_ARUDO